MDHGRLRWAIYSNTQTYTFPLVRTQCKFGNFAKATVQFQQEPLKNSAIIRNITLYFNASFVPGSNRAHLYLNSESQLPFLYCLYTIAFQSTQGWSSATMSSSKYFSYYLTWSASPSVTSFFQVAQLKMLKEPLIYMISKEHFSTFYIFLSAINRGLEM